MSRIVKLYNADEGCRFHRLLQPARFVGAEPEFAGRVVCDKFPDRRPGDAVVVHGGFMERSLPVWVGEAVHEGGKFVWSIDDDFKSIPDWNPYKPKPEAWWGYHFPARAADAVLCSTESLADTFRGKVFGDVFVAPNLHDLTLYPTPEPPKNTGVVTIVWAGSPTHRRDVEVVEKAVDHVLTKYSRRAEFIFIGGPPPDGLMQRWLHRGLDVLDGQPLALYPQVLTAARPHVFLAPMFPCDFNRSKSNLRVLDGWALSSAVVASPFGEYACVRDGLDGLVAGSPDEWVDALDALVRNDGLRERLGAAGRKRAEAEYDWNNPACRGPWRAFYRAVLGDATPEENANVLPRNLVAA